MSQACILVPLDGTPQAAAALPFALGLARGSRAGIVLLGAVQREELKAGHIDAAQRYLQRVARELHEAGPSVHTIAHVGGPVEAVLRQVRPGSADLIVVATGHSCLKRLLLGSVAAELVRQSPVPVIVLRPGRRRVTRVERILVPLDGSPEAASILAPTVNLARTLGAAITLLRVLEHVSIPADAAQDGGEHIGETVDQAYSYLAGIEKRLAETGLWVESCVRTGAPAEAITSVTDERRADLVAMATHGRGVLGKASLDSVTDQVFRCSEVPVLTLSLLVQSERSRE